MGNLHGVAASAVTLVTTAETVLATVGPFNENEVGEFAQGVILQSNLNLTVGTGGTAVVLRIRKNSLTGTLVGVAQTATVTAGNVAQLGCDELDTSLIQPGISYVLTASVTSASANSTCNRVVFTAEAATAFE